MTILVLTCKLLIVALQLCERALYEHFFYKHGAIARNVGLIITQGMRKPSSSSRAIKVKGGCLSCLLVLMTMLLVILNIRIAAYYQRKSGNQRKRKASKANSSLRRPHHHLDSLLNFQTNAIPGKDETGANNVVPNAMHLAGSRKKLEAKQRSGLHLVFSTSCNLQDYRSYVVFFKAMLLRQLGSVTRIVSGCSNVEQRELSSFHNAHITPMSNQFHIHFTPAFTKGNKDSKLYDATKYWNKPFGVKHWLENTFHYPKLAQDANEKDDNDDDIVVLIDPDMILQWPFANDFSPFLPDMWSDYFRVHAEERVEKVSHGHPIAQDYNYRDDWLNVAKRNLSYVLGSHESPVYKLSALDAKQFYSAGPPYMLTVRDMYRLVCHWTDFLPRMFDLHPYMMAEMYSYSLAAAHLALPHQLARGLMVSDVSQTETEGWYFMKNLPPEQICRRNITLPNLPFVIHYCQSYSIGEFYFHKSSYPNNWLLDCSSPLLRLPRVDEALTNYSHFGDGTKLLYLEQYRWVQHKNAYLICSILSTLQEAARYFKQHHCSTGTNDNETWNYFESELFLRRINEK